MATPSTQRWHKYSRVRMEFPMHKTREGDEHLQQRQKSNNVSQLGVYRVALALFLWSKAPYLTVFICFSDMAQGVVMETKAGSDLGISWMLFVRILTQNLESKYAFFWPPPLSPSCLSLLVIIHLPFPSAFPLNCRIPLSLSSPQVSQVLFASIRLKIWPSVYPKRISGALSKALSEEKHRIADMGKTKLKRNTPPIPSQQK